MFVLESYAFLRQKLVAAIDLGRILSNAAERGVLDGVWTVVSMSQLQIGHKEIVIKINRKRTNKSPHQKRNPNPRDREGISLTSPRKDSSELSPSFQLDMAAAALARRGTAALATGGNGAASGWRSVEREVRLKP